MFVLNAIETDATFVRISLWNLNLFLVFRRAKNSLFISDFLVGLKPLFIWPLAGNVVCNIRGGSRKFRKRGLSLPPSTPPPPAPHSNENFTFRISSNEVTLTCQKHFENAKKKGGRGPLGPSPKSAFEYVGSATSDFWIKFRNHKSASSPTNNLWSSSAF